MMTESPTTRKSTPVRLKLDPRLRMIEEQLARLTEEASGDKMLEPVVRAVEALHYGALAVLKEAIHGVTADYVKPRRDPWFLATGATVYFKDPATAAMYKLSITSPLVVEEYGVMTRVRLPDDAIAMLQRSWLQAAVSSGPVAVEN